MNIVGKTLVIINLVFALLVAGFLVMDFATRSNWKTGCDKVKGELDISRANTQTAQDTNKKLLDDKKTAEANLNVLEKKFKAYEREAGENLDKSKRQAQDEADKAKAAEFNQMKIGAENNRLQAEVKDITALVKKRDEMVLTLQADSNRYRQEALANEHKANSANQRSLALLEQLRQKEIELVRLETMGKAGASTTPLSPRNPAYRNPPAVNVKGVVEKVDPADPMVAQISIGSDEGLKEGNTLEVYRLTPRPDYIGTLLLRDVNHHTALGKLLPSPGGAQRKALKTGDEVASKIVP